jgi:hypothetical protein
MEVALRLYSARRLEPRFGKLIREQNFAQEHLRDGARHDHGIPGSAGTGHQNGNDPFSCSCAYISHGLDSLYGFRRPRLGNAVDRTTLSMGEPRNPPGI